MNFERSSPNTSEQARSEHGPQPGVIRAGTEDFSCQATAVPSRNVVETIDKYKYDVLVWTCQNTIMRMPALLDTQCGPNLIREDIVQEAGLHIRPYLGPSLSQVDGSYYLPAGQFTTRIRFCGGTRTFKIDFLLAPSNAGYDILLGGPFISKAQLLLRNPAGFFLSFARETPRKFANNEHNTKANGVIAEQTAERQRRQQEDQRANEQRERQRTEERRHQREREMAEEQRRQIERDRRLAASSSRRG